MPKSITPAKRGRSAASNRRNNQSQDKREQYEREADALITLLELEYGDHDEGADIGNLKKRPLMKGIERHMRELFNRADFRNPLTVRRFYVEMRLWGDVLTTAFEQGTLLIKESDLEGLS